MFEHIAKALGLILTTGIILVVADELITRYDERTKKH